MENQEQQFVLVMAIWIGAGLVGIWIFQISKDIERKKRLLRPFIIGTGVLFALLFLWVWRRTDDVLIFIPAIALITWINLRNMKICGSCGKFLHNPTFWSKMEFCSKCGASLSDDNPNSLQR